MQYFKYNGFIINMVIISKLNIQLDIINNINKACLNLCHVKVRQLFII